MFTKNDTTKYCFRHRGFDNDALWAYRNGSLVYTIAIDNTYDAVYWCKRHNMVVSEIVTADNDKRYAIWRGDNRVCALPIRNKEVSS